MLTWQYGERTRAAGVGRGGFLSVFWAGGGEGSGGVLFLGQSGGPPLWVSPLGVPFVGFEGFGVCALEGAQLWTFCSWHIHTGDYGHLLSDC